MKDRRRRADQQADTDNPFAAPDKGQPAQPWRPHGEGPLGERPDSAPEAGGTAPEGSRGGRWSKEQPGGGGGPFGGGSGGGSGGAGGPGGPGPGGPGKRPRGLRWDPSDPRQRHARYALHAGVWGLFFALFSMSEIALLLGALALYWGIGSLRGTSGRGGGPGRGAKAGSEDVGGTGGGPRTGASAVAVDVTPEQAARSRTSAAISGIVAAGLALAVVAATFSLQLVYDDYFTCQQDSLTQASREGCKDLLPEQIRPFLDPRR